MPPTHVVENQAPLRVGGNAFTDDPLLPGLVAELGAGSHADRLSVLGASAASAQTRELADRANTFLPRLRTHDRYGHRVDEVDYDPAYHALMRTATGAGLHASSWLSGEAGAHVARAAGFFVWSQAEPGHMCPISMTYAAVPALAVDPALAATWTPGLAARAYDERLRPHEEKPGLIAGMAMTEKQGGSDVRANSTRAVPQADGTYLLTGHKWFCSAPMSDVFLVLAQAPDGITCFVVPRVLDDGTRNPIRIQRLKDKLGNRANASSEVEYDGVVGWRLGDEGRGVRTIVEMVSATRLDCVLGSAALMRASVAEAQWHTRHRQAFGKPLVEQPLMHAVLADLEVETQAATVLGMRLAAAVDADDESQRRLRRIALPASKFLVTKRSMAVTGEALECLGGNGYAEESGMPRLYREAPVNSVWEGSGNVNALDLLRAITREDGVVDALADELATVRGADAVLDAAADETIAALRAAQASSDEAAARGLAERTATTLQAALLVRYAAPAVADAFVATRVVTRHVTFGANPRPLTAVPLP